MNERSSPAQSAVQGSGKSTANLPSNFSVNSQPSLFDENEKRRLPGSMNDAAVVRALLVDAIRLSGKSREQIAEEMSALTGTDVTVRRINAFTAESREDYRFPSELDRAFCVVTGNYELIRYKATTEGFHIVTEAEYGLLELGREYLRQKRAADQMTMLEKTLAGMKL